MNECSVCGRNDFSIVKDALRDGEGTFKVFKCSSCGLVQLLPRPSDQDNKGFYDTNKQDRNRGKGIDYGLLESNQRADTLRHVRIVKELGCNAPSVLDIGSGYGFFVKALYAAGFNVKGLEISDERRAISLKHTKAEIIPLDVAAGPDKMGNYDIVTMFHVLEHTSDPVKFLKDVRALLKKDGVLIIEVPNVEESLLKNSPEYNDFYWIRAHIYYFAKETLGLAMKKAGFSDVRVSFSQRYGLVNLGNWLYTGKPQIERPVFDIPQDYAETESFYRRSMESSGKSDTIIAEARIGEAGS